MRSAWRGFWFSTPALLGSKALRVSDLALLKSTHRHKTAFRKLKCLATVRRLEVVELNAISQSAFGFAEGAECLVEKACEVER